MNHYSPSYFHRYFIKKESNQFFLSIFLRSLALGMVLIFEPIYLYFYFDKSLPLTLLFFALIHGLFALLAVFGAKLMAKIGFDWSMLISHFFYLTYYILLAFISFSSFFVFLAVIMKALGMTLFWPSYHTNFIRFSEEGHRGKEVGKIGVIGALPTILGPAIGGFILFSSNYSILFGFVLVVLLMSSIPLFLNREERETYTDGYQKAWKRVFHKKNRKYTLAFAASSIEVGIDNYLWPIFMAVLSISYISMGGIISFSFFVSALFMLYMGRVSDSKKRVKALDLGAILTSISWIIKYFVITPFSAFLAQSFYRLCRTTVGIPFQTLFYEKAAREGSEADEFIIYREIVINVTRFLSLLALAGLFLLIPRVSISFLIAALASLGFTFISTSQKRSKKKISKR